MSPKSEHVERELLTIGFRAYPRGLVNGFVFAFFSVVLMWPKLPHELLLAWLAAFTGVLALRWSIARAFLAHPQPATSFAGWTRRAAFGYGTTGLAWGILGAASVHYAFD